MSRVTSIVIATMAIAAAACSAPQQQEFTTKDAQEIRQQNDAFVQAFNAKKVPQMMNLYAENSVFMPPNQPTVRGKAALTNFYRDMVEHATSLHLEVGEVSGAGPIAYQTGTYEMETKASPLGHDRGKYLFVLRNMGGTWRYEYSMWNSDLPPAHEAATN